MAGTIANFLTTSFLTLACATILFITYRIALRPILQSIPLQTLFAGRVMLRDDDDDDGGAGALEEGFRDDSDEEGEGRDVRVRG